MRVDGNEILLEHLGAGVGGRRRTAARQGTRDRPHAVRAAVGQPSHQGLLRLGRVREHVQRDHVAITLLWQGLARARRVVVDDRIVRNLDPVVVEDLAVRLLLLLVDGVLLFLEALLLAAPAQVVALVLFLAVAEGRVHDPVGAGRCCRRSADGQRVVR